MQTRLLTDDAGYCRLTYRHFASHQTTLYTKGVYVDPTNPVIHTTASEGSFSISKRGMKGVYQRGEQHSTAVWRSLSSAMTTGWPTA